MPARVETVVLYLPDVWSCQPTRLEWDGLHLNYKKQLDRLLNQDDEPESDDKALQSSAYLYCNLIKVGDVAVSLPLVVPDTFEVR